MKILLLHLFIFFTLIILPPYSANSQENSIKSYYVWAKSGLSIRDTPEKTSKKTTVIPYGSKIEIIETTNETLTISEFSGFSFTDYWAKVKYKEYTGYSFKGYISEHKPPEISKYSIRSYLNENYRLTNETITKKKNCHGAECPISSFYTFKEGISYSLSESEVSSDYSLSIPKLNILQAFILASHFCFIDSETELKYFKQPLHTITARIDGAGCDFTIISGWGGC